MRKTGSLPSAYGIREDVTLAFVYPLMGGESNYCKIFIKLPGRTAPSNKQLRRKRGKTTIRQKPPKRRTFFTPGEKKKSAREDRVLFTTRFPRIGIQIGGRRHLSPSFWPWILFPFASFVTHFCFFPKIRFLLFL